MAQFIRHHSRAALLWSLLSFRREEKPGSEHHRPTVTLPPLPFFVRFRSDESESTAAVPPFTLLSADMHNLAAFTSSPPEAPLLRPFS
ncbi:unnamed protein product [Lactuca virosa]|uniref:Secreted protein n=1 Tax=Lactuca virosa TaxID=75947 RepID=A0AAU9NBH4_9ASTR|nr:unnamed protein product [Lactuca virosa]